MIKKLEFKKDGGTERSRKSASSSQKQQKKKNSLANLKKVEIIERICPKYVWSCK